MKNYVFIIILIMTISGCYKNLTKEQNYSKTLPDYSFPVLVPNLIQKSEIDIFTGDTLPRRPNMRVIEEITSSLLEKKSDYNYLVIVLYSRLHPRTSVIYGSEDFSEIKNILLKSGFPTEKMSFFWKNTYDDYKSLYPPIIVFTLTNDKNRKNMIGDFRDYTDKIE